MGPSELHNMYLSSGAFMPMVQLQNNKHAQYELTALMSLN